MKIPILGELRPHPDVADWFISAPCEIPYFDGKRLIFSFDGLEEFDEKDANAAVEAFLALTAADRAAAGHYVYANYRKLAEQVDAKDLGCFIASETDVWGYVHPQRIFVLKRYQGRRAIYIQIAAECDWEREHGLQIIYRRGAMLFRVSEQDGQLTHADAYGLPEDEDRIA